MDRNPSPPPELLTDGNEVFVPDRIKDSLYSKKWIYQTLMKIVQLCEKSHKESIAQNPSSPASDSMEDSEPIKNEIIELDPTIEEDACTLWDMSANKDVTEFLNETGVPGIILDIVNNTKSPRLLEIAIGILGNISSFNATCMEISKNKNILQTVLQLSGTSDSPTLLQVFRVILCGVCNQNTQNMWFETFGECLFFFDNLKFIFENCLNCDVLKEALNLLHNVLNENVEYCITWGEESNIKAIIKAGTQLNLRHSVDNFFSVMNSLLQYTPNVKKCVEQWEELNTLFTAYFLSFEEYEPLPNQDRVASVIACFDTYNSLLKCDSLKKEQLVIDLNVLKAIHRVACSVNSMVLKVTKDGIEVSDTEHRRNNQDREQCVTTVTDYEFQTWTILVDTIIETARILKNYVEKVTERELLEDILNLEVAKEENLGVDS